MAASAGGERLFVAYLRDLTERVRAAEALRASEARLAAFMEHAPVGMYLKDLDGRYVMLNPEMEKVLGRPAGEMLGQEPAAAFGPEEVGDDPGLRPRGGRDGPADPARGAPARASTPMPGAW